MTNNLVLSYRGGIHTSDSDWKDHVTVLIDDSWYIHVYVHDYRCVI